MDVKDIDAYRAKRGLVETTDPEIDRPLSRKTGFDGVVSFGDMDTVISEFLRDARKAQGLTREGLAELLGLSGQVYGRYERAFSKMHVTRLIHLSELLGFKPMEMIYAAAPHLFGETEEEATNQIALMRLMSKMKPATVESLLKLIADISGDAETPTSLK
jgi:transcriptional regulator with XRE-family HTH domain